ncbi:hypothetical protein EU527_06700 [Candidatus Thorarchaeota archaeon]|nr:MAG: hypothetical protein EU527_06700 [Candidatus Thorarchaeota archaeon]
MRNILRISGWFHRSLGGFSPIILAPYLDTKEHGLLSTRTPSRPNSIGIPIVRLDSIDRNRSNIEGVDMLDETPLIDIKPFVPEFDNRLSATSRWLARTKIVEEHPHIADDRFDKQ